MKSDYDAWKNGTMLFNGCKFVPVSEGKEDNAKWMRSEGISEEVIQEYLTNDKNLLDLIDEEYLYYYDLVELYRSEEENDYCLDHTGLETFCEQFTTPKGEEIIVFGEYGYNG